MPSDWRHLLAGLSVYLGADLPFVVLGYRYPKDPTEAPNFLLYVGGSLLLIFVAYFAARKIIPPAPQLPPPPAPGAGDITSLSDLLRGLFGIIIVGAISFSPIWISMFIDSDNLTPWAFPPFFLAFLLAPLAAGMRWQWHSM